VPTIHSQREMGSEYVFSCIQVFKTRCILEEQCLSKMDGIKGVNNRNREYSLKQADVVHFRETFQSLGYAIISEN
jgi:hypothetical protein